MSNRDLIETISKGTKAESVIINYGKRPHAELVDRFYDKIPVVNAIMEELREFDGKCLNVPNPFNSLMMRTVGELDTMVMPAGFHIFKGMTTYYPPTYFDGQGADRSKIYWFGDKYIATKYCHLYQGSLHSYKFVKETDLIVMNRRNLVHFTEMVKKLHKSANDPKMKKLYESIYGAFIVKYGVDHEPAARHNYILRHFGHNYWRLYVLEDANPISAYCENVHFGIENSMGHGVIDRIVYGFLSAVAKNAGLSGFIHPQSKSVYIGWSTGEIILNDMSVVARDFSDPLDVEQWKHIINPPPNFVLVESFVRKNRSHKMIDFYRSNMDPSPITPPGFNIMTYNVHGFSPINSLLTQQGAIDHFFRLMYEHSIVIACLQEFPGDLFSRFFALCKEKKLLVYGPSSLRRETPQRESLTNIIVVKPMQSLQINGVKDRFYRSRQNYKKRGYIMLEMKINGAPVSLATTHLEIWSVPHRMGEHTMIQELKDKTQAQNIATRSEQINELIDASPNIILGDFNFTENDPEYEIVKRRGYATRGLPVNTTPFNTVDHVFVRGVELKFVGAINSVFSDHRPVIASL